MSILDKNASYPIIQFHCVHTRDDIEVVFVSPSRGGGRRRRRRDGREEKEKKEGKKERKKRSRYWRRVRGPDIGTPTFIVTNDTAVNSPLTPSRVGSSKQERTCPFSALSLHSSSFFPFSFPPLFFFFSRWTFRLSLDIGRRYSKVEYNFELKKSCQRRSRWINILINILNDLDLYQHFE